MQTKIKNLIQNLTNHPHIKLATRGNTAIDAALKLLLSNSTLLIPEEGSWIHYQKAPKKLGLKAIEVVCTNAKINIEDLKIKLQNKPSAFLYQNPGGYFAEQPFETIYNLCKKHHCLVILDASGSLGTSLCNGKYADIIICSFGKGKLVNAEVGGFISCKDKNLFAKIQTPQLETTHYPLILEKLKQLNKRIDKLNAIKEKIINDLKEHNILYPHDTGFVLLITYKNDTEKTNLIDYCQTNNLPYTECPRYIRIKRPAISIEIKRL